MDRSKKILAGSNPRGFLQAGKWTGLRNILMVSFSDKAKVCWAVGGWWWQHISWQSCKKTFMCVGKRKQMKANKLSLEHSCIRFSTFLTASKTEKPLWKARSWRHSYLLQAPRADFANGCRALWSSEAWDCSRSGPVSVLQPPFSYSCWNTSKTQSRAISIPSKSDTVRYSGFSSDFHGPSRNKTWGLTEAGALFQSSSNQRYPHEIRVNGSLGDEYFPCYFKVVQQSPTPALGGLDDGLSREKMPPGRNDVIASIPTFQTLSDFGHLFPKHLQNLQ